MQRQPCPWRILDDAGGAFAMGAICGTAWHGVRGYRTGPRVSVLPLSSGAVFGAPVSVHPHAVHASRDRALSFVTYGMLCQSPPPSSPCRPGALLPWGVLQGLKFAEAMQAVKIRAPVMAGGFGMWGLSFASFDCSLV